MKRLHFLAKNSAIVRQFGLAILFFSLQSSLVAQEIDVGRFREDLSKMILGSNDPIKDAGNDSYLSVVIVPSGEAWSPSTSEDESIDRGPWGTSPIALQFNYPLSVVGGVPFAQRQQRIEKIWERVISSSMPKTRIEQSDSESILFRPTDRVDVARGLGNKRQASEPYLLYQEYRSAWQILETASPGDVSWRFHPRFNGFATLEEAKFQIASDWLRFGLKVEIEAAVSEFDRANLGNGWKNWLDANTAFRSNTVNVVPGIPTGRTWMFPTESEWPTMRSWSNATFSASSGQLLKCQIARVKILRPWLEIQLLLDKEFSIGQEADLELISDGVIPNSDAYAKGVFANYIEELIIVRRIIAESAQTDHPLGRFVYPEAINLIAYVVRSLPKVETRN